MLYRADYIVSFLVVILLQMMLYLLIQFYFQDGRPPPTELKERCLFRINQFFYGHMDGLQINGEIYLSI